MAGAETLRDVLPAFPGGDVIIGVLGPFYKCPAAPYECAMMLHDLLEKQGVRDKSTIKIFTPMGVPIPISEDASTRILEGFEARGIEFHPQEVVASLDGATHTATMRDGHELHYDLFLGIPVHRAPAVVEASGLAVDGWIPVDHTTFATSFPGVYAVGDITSAPVPRVGVIAEGEAGTVADVLIHQLKGGAEPPPYPGVATCYVEFGGAEVAKFDVNFLGGPVAVRCVRRAVGRAGRVEEGVRRDAPEALVRPGVAAPTRAGGGGTSRSPVVSSPRSSDSYAVK